MSSFRSWPLAMLTVAILLCSGLLPTRMAQAQAAAAAAAPDARRLAGHPLDPGTPVPAPQYQALPAPESALAPQPADAAAALARWRSAHERVAEFPRGHADIVQWERAAATRSPATPSSPAASAPAPSPAPRAGNHPH